MRTANDGTYFALGLREGFNVGLEVGFVLGLPEVGLIVGLDGLELGFGVGLDGRTVGLLEGRGDG
jgi:hypothetical protein